MLFAQLMCSVVVSGDLLRGGAELPPREEPRLLPTLLSVLGSADAFQVGGPLRAPQRSASPVMQLRNPFKAPAPAPEPAKGPFGLSNPFQSSEPASKGVVASTKAVRKPALKKFKQNDKAVARGLLPTLAVLGAPVGGGLAILLATLFVSPSLAPDGLPFNFLDQFYPPAIERKARVAKEVKAIEEVKEAEKKKEAAKKAAAEAEAKKAEEEKAKEEAKKAKAAPKAAAPAPAPAPAAAPKPAPAPPPAKKLVPAPDTKDLVLTAPKGATTTIQAGAQPFRAPTPAGAIAKGGDSASAKAIRPGTPDGLGQSACFPRARCDEVKGFRRNEAGTQYLGSDLLGLPAPGTRRNAFDANGESNKFYDLLASKRKAAQDEADQLAAAQQKAFAAKQAAAKAKAEALRAGETVEAAAQAADAQVLTGKKGVGKLFGPLGYGTRSSLEAAGGSIYAYPGFGALPQEISTGSSYKTGELTVLPRETSRPNSKEGTMGADVKKASTGPTDIRGSARLASYEKAKAAELRAKAEAKAAETAARNAEKEEALAEQRMQAAQAQAEKIAAREAKQAVATQQQQELVAAQQARIDQARAERAAR